MTDCKRRRLFAHAAFCAVAAAAMLAWAPAAHGAGPELLLRPGESPLVTLRLVFRAGAASDPAGKAGAAALTAAMLSAGGSRKMSYDDIVDAFFPMAAGVSAQVDKEMTVFSGTTHVENLDAYYEILRQMLLEPGWRKDDFDRLKDKTLNDLRVRLSSQQRRGTGQGVPLPQDLRRPPLRPATLRRGALPGSHDARRRQNLLRSQLPAGQSHDRTGGRLPRGLPPAGAQRLRGVRRRRPRRNRAARARVPRQAARSHRREGHALHAHLPGLPARSQPRPPRLAGAQLMQSYFGQHRSSKSRLYQRIREIRA